MFLLVTGALKCSEKFLQDLQSLNYRVAFLQNESDALPCDYSDVEAVICNGLFLYHSIEKFTNLKYIQLTSAGFDRVPMEYVSKHGIKIYNARGVYSIPMAEFAVCGVLDIYKQSRFFANNQSKHLWDKHRDLLELCGKTVCIIGCGNVGYECAKRFSAFGTTVVGVDIARPTLEIYDHFFNFDNITEAIKISDIIVLTLPLTDKTKNIFDNKMFENFKKNSILVNISRGAIVNQFDLISALQNGQLAGAVLDVFETEPLCADSPIWDMQNVILTPHNSFVGEGNNDRLYKVILDNLRRMS